MLGLTEGEWKDLLTAKRANRADWKEVTRKEQPEVNFEIRKHYQGPVLITRGGLGSVVYVGENGPHTAKKHSCIEITYEYKVSGRTNSGFHFSIPPDSKDRANGVIKKGLEVQALSKEAGNGLGIRLGNYRKAIMDGRMLNDDRTRDRNKTHSSQTGSFYTYAGPSATPDLDGDWHTVTLKLNHLDTKDGGMEMWLYINGGQVNYHNQGVHSPVSIPDDREKDINVPDQSMRAHGHIALQAHDTGSVAGFRNIKWRYVDDPDPAGNQSE